MADNLRRGDRNSEVGRLQVPLSIMGLYKKKIDDDFGPGTQESVIALQQYHMQSDNGIVTDATWTLMARLMAVGWRVGHPWELRAGVMVYGYRHPKHGAIPVQRGRVSHFGGDDPDDRMYGLALIGNDLQSLHKAGRWRDLVELGVFDKDRVDACQTLPKGRGISFLQDTDNSYYCAMQWWSRANRPDPHHARIGAMNDTGDIVSVCPTDLGPAKPDWFKNKGWLPKHFDTSKKCLKMLGLRTEQMCNMLYLADDTPLGLM